LTTADHSIQVPQVLVEWFALLFLSAAVLFELK
jgi:hypothetical protein